MTLHAELKIFVQFTNRVHTADLHDSQNDED